MEGWLLLVLVAVVLGALLGYRQFRSFGREIHYERAREAFKLQRERLEAHFLAAAAASGKPRGLRWVEVEWEREVTFARERHSRQLAALVGATIRFEAVEGGDMEGLPAVGNLRNASAVFFFHRGQWHTVGKAIFNMNPGEAVEHFKNTYERLE